MTEETKPVEAKLESALAEAEAPKPEWRFTEEFAITGRMKEVIGKAIEASEKELDVLRKKLERLTYGG